MRKFTAIALTFAILHEMYCATIYNGGYMDTWKTNYNGKDSNENKDKGFLKNNLEYLSYRLKDSEMRPLPLDTRDDEFAPGLHDSSLGSADASNTRKRIIVPGLHDSYIGSADASNTRKRMFVPGLHDSYIGSADASNTRKRIIVPGLHDSYIGSADASNTRKRMFVPGLHDSYIGSADASNTRKHIIVPGLHDSSLDSADGSNTRERAFAPGIHHFNLNDAAMNNREIISRGSNDVDLNYTDSTKRKVSVHGLADNSLPYLNRRNVIAHWLHDVVVPELHESIQKIDILARNDLDARNSERKGISKSNFNDGNKIQLNDNVQKQLESDYKTWLDTTNNESDKKYARIYRKLFLRLKDENNNAAQNQHKRRKVSSSLRDIGHKMKNSVFLGGDENHNRYHLYPYSSIYYLGRYPPYPIRKTEIK